MNLLCYSLSLNFPVPPFLWIVTVNHHYFYWWHVRIRDQDPKWKQKAGLLKQRHIIAGRAGGIPWGGAGPLFWDWIFLGLFEVGGHSTCSGLISNGGCFQSFGGLLPQVGKRSCCCHFYFIFFRVPKFTVYAPHPVLHAICALHNSH